jgi:hypothetical protein
VSVRRSPELGAKQRPADQRGDQARLPAPKRAATLAEACLAPSTPSSNPTRGA